MHIYDNTQTEECRGIGLENESSLHSALKRWYLKPGDRLEVKVDGYIADILRNDLIIEIQTGNFTSIRNKLYCLTKNHKVKLVYPIPEEKYIVKLSSSKDAILSRRRSPRKGKPEDLFKELLRIPALINNDNFMLEILLIQEEDIFCQDGRGSWRRRGASIIDKKLIRVNSSTEFCTKKNFLIFLPDNLPQVFTNKIYSKVQGCSLSISQKTTYCLKKMGLIKEVGKKGNELLFEIADDI